MILSVSAILQDLCQELLLGDTQSRPLACAARSVKVTPPGDAGPASMHNTVDDSEAKLGTPFNIRKHCCRCMQSLTSEQLKELKAGRKLQQCWISLGSNLACRGSSRNLAAKSWHMRIGAVRCSPPAAWTSNKDSEEKDARHLLEIHVTTASAGNLAPPYTAPILLGILWGY